MLPGFDHAEARTWRHLDTCQFQTRLHAEIPRVQCPAHGVKQVRVPWAEPRSRFTLLMERLIIDLILQCSTVKGACQIASVSWDEAWGIMSRAVARDQARKEARPITYIGVDEKAFRKGHRYHTIVCDLERKQPIWFGVGCPYWSPPIDLPHWRQKDQRRRFQSFSRLVTIRSGSVWLRASTIRAATPPAFTFSTTIWGPSVLSSSASSFLNPA